MQEFTVLCLHTSSVFGTLLLPGLSRVPVDAIVRKLRGGEGPNQSALPVVPEHFHQILFPTEVVSVGFSVGLESGFA